MPLSEDIFFEDFSKLSNFIEILSENKAAAASLAQSILWARKRFPELSPSAVSLLVEVLWCRDEAVRLQSVFGIETAANGISPNFPLFTSSLLQQSTHPHIAMRHAEKYKGISHIVEVCAGAGMDSIALALTAERLTSIEKDITTAALHRHNMLLSGLGEKVQTVAGTAEEVLGTDTENLCEIGLWADPARRSAWRRNATSTAEWQPSLDFLFAVGSRCERAGIKISPAADIATPVGWVREWIGGANDCREQVLWHNVDFPDGTVRLVHTRTGTCHTWQPSPEKLSRPALIPPEEVPGKFVVEPHPALIRSGYLEQWAAENTYRFLHHKIAYCVAETLPPPDNEQYLWGNFFAIEEIFPFDKKQLRKKLQQRGWNTRTEIKKRGWEGKPEELLHYLQLASPTAKADYGVIIITRLEKRHFCFLGKRAEPLSAH